MNISHYSANCVISHIFWFIYLFIAGKSPEDAADIALDYMKTRVGGLGGVIVISRSGHWSARFSTKQMAWAAVEDGLLQSGICAGEREEPSAEEAEGEQEEEAGEDHAYSLA